MSKSHFPIDLGLLTAIRQLIPPGSKIVELGSGNGTNILTKQYNVYSIEDDAKWIGYCKETNYIHAPLVETDYKNQKIRWYDSEVISRNLPDDYDLILVDGPAGKHGRYGLLENLNIFKTDVPIVIDDTLRDHEAEIARQIAYMLNRPLYMFWNFSIISPDILTQSQIAKIQQVSLEVQNKESDKYLLTYFHSSERLANSNLEYYDSVIELEKRQKLELGTLKASKRKLDLIEKSFSLRIGRILTLPVRALSKIRRN